MIRPTFLGSGLFSCLFLFVPLLQWPGLDENNSTKNTQNATGPPSAAQTLLNLERDVISGDTKASSGEAAAKFSLIDSPVAQEKPDAQHAQSVTRSGRDDSKLSTKSASHKNSTTTKSGAAIEADRDIHKPRAASPKSAVELSPQMKRRQNRIARCLAIYYAKHVDADELRPWSIMHGLIAFGRETVIVRSGKLYKAVDYLCHNGVGHDKQLLYLNAGQLQTRVGQGVQGHEGQFLAMLAQSNVPRDQPIGIERAKFSVKDLIEFEKRGCRSHTELTFKLIGLAHYLDLEESWKNQAGETWNVERLIAEELEQPINGAACGGSHRLMALSYAVRKRIDSGRSLDGHWQRAANFINNYHDYTLTMQNPDGSFSTRWFERREANSDAKRRLYTTGHILEWLVFSLPDERLTDPRITKALDYVVNLMLAAPNHELDVGPKGHALHALMLYEQRMFGGNSNYRQLAMRMSNRERINNAQKQADIQPESQNMMPLRGLFRRR